MKTNTHDFIDAMEKNGYKRARGAWVRTTAGGKVINACAMGQAMLNLGADPQRTQDAARNVPVDLMGTIIDRNDSYNWAVDKIVAFIKNHEVYGKYYTEPVEFEVEDRFLAR